MSSQKKSGKYPEVYKWATRLVLGAIIVGSINASFGSFKETSRKLQANSKDIEINKVKIENNHEKFDQIQKTQTITNNKIDSIYKILIKNSNK